MKIKKGEIWKVDSRNFKGVFKVLKDIDTKEDDFFDAEIIEGTKFYLTRESKGIGNIISFRTTLTTFLKRIKNG